MMQSEAEKTTKNVAVKREYVMLRYTDPRINLREMSAPDHLTCFEQMCPVVFLSQSSKF